MPPGTPYNAFIPPYSIRVDDFTSLPVSSSSPSHAQEEVPKNASLYLLTHTHTDHLTGLSARSFGQQIICSRDAKEMLLRHEVYAERSLRDADFRAENVRTFAHLKVDPQRMENGQMDYFGSRDLLRATELHSPTKFTLNEEEEVVITLFDANHCPGAVMFLVEGTKGAVLHTGDLRAEPWFLDNLKRNQYIQRYIDIPRPLPSRTNSDETFPKLETIYLDTACLLNTYDVPAKAEAVAKLVSLMAVYPCETRFFINLWTWGYEEIYKAVAKAFQTKIHVDRYKHGVYSHISDPFLQSIITRDEQSTRFHACERFERCEHVRVNGRESHTPNGNHVVYINPVNMDISKWQKYLEETEQQLSHGTQVNILLVPLARHSPLPELRNFVSLFKPRRVVPNTLDPTLKGLDAACMQAMFADCLAQNNSDDPVELPVISLELGELDSTFRNDSEGYEDVAFKNLEGEGAREMAEKWADSGRMRKKLSAMKDYLPPPQKEVVEQILEGRYDYPSTRVFKRPDNLQPSRYHDSGTKTNLPSPSPPRLSGRQRDSERRASNKETRAAMTRLSFRAPNNLPSSQGMDSETDDEGREDTHTMVATYLWGHQSGIPDALNPYHTLDIERSSSPQPVIVNQTVAGPSRLVRLPSQMPLTPRSKHGSQDLSHWLKSSSPAVSPEPPSPVAGRGHPYTPRGSSVTQKRVDKGKMCAMPTPETTTRCVPPRDEASTRDPCALFPTLTPALPITSRRKRPRWSPSVDRDPSRDDVVSDGIPLLERRNLVETGDDPIEENITSLSPSPKRRRVGCTATPRQTDEGHAARSEFRISSYGNARPRTSTRTIVPALAIEVQTVVTDESAVRRPARSQHGAVPAAPDEGEGGEGEGEKENEDKGIAVGAPQDGAHVGLGTGRLLATNARTKSGRTRPRTGGDGGGKNIHGKRRMDSERVRIREKLASVHPDRVTSAYKEKMERGGMLREQVQALTQPTQASTTTHAVLDSKAVSGSSQRKRVKLELQERVYQIPSRLPSQDEVLGEEQNARIQQLRAEIKKGLADGERAGVVIPRLQCLESQEESMSICVC